MRLTRREVMSTLAGAGTLAGVGWGGLGSSPYAMAGKSTPSISLSFGMVPDPDSYQALSSVNGGPASNYGAPPTRSLCPSSGLLAFGADILECGWDLAVGHFEHWSGAHHGLDR